jgi:hypothetical protein
MAMGRMDEEVVEEREPSARGRGGRRGRTKIQGSTLPRFFPLLPSSRRSQCPTRISPSPVNPLQIRIRRSRREIDPLGGIGCTSARQGVECKAETETDCGGGGYVYDTHHSSARLRVKQMCPPPPPQRIPLRTPSHRPRLHDGARRRAGASTCRSRPLLPSTSTRRSRRPR